jgi:hypothetical protein
VESLSVDEFFLALEEYARQAPALARQRLQQLRDDLPSRLHELTDHWLDYLQQRHDEQTRAQLNRLFDEGCTRSSQQPKEALALLEQANSLCPNDPPPVLQQWLLYTRFLLSAFEAAHKWNSSPRLARQQLEEAKKLAPTWWDKTCQRWLEDLSRLETLSAATD